MRETSKDRRVRRTRACLRQALIELLGEKELRAITVSELTQRADVNRGTFYAHYQDIFDMLEQTVGELFRDLVALLEGYDPNRLKGDLTAILTEVFQLVLKNQDIFLALIQQQGLDTLFKPLSQVIYDKCLREWDGMYLLGDFTDTNYYLEYLVSGVIGVVRAWAGRNFKESPQEMAALTNQLILFGLSPLLQE